MGPKKGRRVRKIEIPTDTPTEFDTADHIQRMSEERQQREREETTHSAEEEVAEKHPRTERSDTKLEHGGEVSTSQL